MSNMIEQKKEEITKNLKKFYPLLLKNIKVNMPL